MKVIYRRHLDPEVEVASPPQPETLGGVLVEWTISGNRLTDISFTVSGATLDKDSSGTIITYNDNVMAKIFAAASFIGDRIRIQTGFDVLDPFSLVGNSPDDVVGETPEEDASLQMDVKRGQRGIRVFAVITRPFDPKVYTDFAQLAVPTGHYARAMRADDPLEKFEDYYKALEYFASRRAGDDPSGERFDKQLSEVTEKVDPKYNKARIETYRILRKRIVHTRTRHALGHIGPADMEGIRKVQALLDEMQQLVVVLLKNPPAFPR